MKEVLVIPGGFVPYNDTVTLLSYKHLRNIDAYFDKFYISFNDDGTILISSTVDKSIAEKYSKYSLDKEILTPERLKYLSYHRKRFLEKHSS